jgi:hypothetical protein
MRLKIGDFATSPAGQNRRLPTVRKATILARRLRSEGVVTVTTPSRMWVLSDSTHIREGWGISPPLSLIIAKATRRAAIGASGIPPSRFPGSPLLSRASTGFSEWAKCPVGLAVLRRERASNLRLRRLRSLHCPSPSNGPESLRR